MTIPASLLLVACSIATVIFPFALLAADPVPPRHQKVEKPTVIDLLLGRGGILEGQLRDAGEHLADGATVSIWQGQKLIWKGSPDEAGKFQLKNVSSGLYRVVYGSQSIICRAWTDDTAPPQAKGSLVIQRDGGKEESGLFGRRILPAGALFPPIWSGTHEDSRLHGHR